MHPKEVRDFINSKKRTQIYYKNTPIVPQKVDMNTGLVSVINLNTNDQMVVPAKTINEHHGLSH